jgi:hypothetical protein
LPLLSPKFLFVIVQKTGIARFFTKDKNDVFQNPSIGTVVDQTIVKNQEYFVNFTNLICRY